MSKNLKNSLNDYSVSKLFGMEILICTGVCIISIILFLELTRLVFNNGFVFLDEAIIYFAFENQTPALTRFMIFISAFGSSIFILTASFLFSAYLFLKKKADSFIFIVIIYTAIILNIFLKFFYGRARPSLNPLVIENSYSYPSFHAMSSFVLYLAIAYFVYRETKNLKLSVVLLILFGLLILLIGLSRVYLGVHYPSDVLAGYLAGFIWILVVIIFQRTIKLEKFYNKNRK